MDLPWVNFESESNGTEGNVMSAKMGFMHNLTEVRSQSVFIMESNNNWTESNDNSYGNKAHISYLH